MLKIIGGDGPAVETWEEYRLDGHDMGLRSRLGRQPLAALWMAMGSTVMIELAASAKADAVVIDMQHGLWDRIGLEAAVGVAATTGAAALVRVAENSAAAIGQALDAGAEGVIVPLVENAGEAAAVVAAARFPPQGRRSGGGVRPFAAGFHEYCAGANERTTVGVMIETLRGVANAGAIAHTPGVDFVLIGTGDLALSIGGNDAAARRDEACNRILRACRDAGTPCAIYTPTAEEAAARVREGYAMVIAATDIMTVSEGFRDAMQRFRSGVETVPAVSQKQKLPGRGKKDRATGQSP